MGDGEFGRSADGQHAAGVRWRYFVHIVFGSAFFAETYSYSAQQITLLHEVLDYTLQRNDQQVVQKYKILPGLFDTFSSAFNKWLTSNCQ